VNQPAEFKVVLRNLTQALTLTLILTLTLTLTLTLSLNLTLTLSLTLTLTRTLILTRTLPEPYLTFKFELLVAAILHSQAQVVKVLGGGFG
jgi:hypothetical protein